MKSVFGIIPDALFLRQHIKTLSGYGEEDHLNGNDA